jgi:type II secretion system protein J
MIRPGHRGGFTLIELLLAMLATSIILGTAYAALFSGLNSYQYGAYKAEIIGVLNRALGRIMEDLSASHVGSRASGFLLVDDVLESEEFGDIPNDRLLFTAAIARTDWTETPQSDLAEVEYFIDADEETPAKWLIRRTQSPPDGNPKQGGEIHMAGPRVFGMEVGLYDGSKWIREWNSSQQLPQAVQITLFILPSTEAVRPRRLEQLTSVVWIPAAVNRAAAGQGEKPEEAPPRS